MTDFMKSALCRIYGVTALSWRKVAKVELLSLREEVPTKKSKSSLADINFEEQSWMEDIQNTKNYPKNDIVRGSLSNAYPNKT